MGNNSDGECEVSDWSDIVVVTTGGAQTVGLKPDGTVVAAGLKEADQRTVGNWTDIVALSDAHGPVGFKLDGTVVTLDKCAGDWKLFESLEKELEASLRAKEGKRSKLQTERSELQDEQAKLQAELPTLKGLFSGGRRREIEARLAAISKRVTEIEIEIAGIEKKLKELEELKGL